MALRAEIRQTIEMCRHCFMCRHANPTFLVTKLDAHTPRGYALSLSRVDDGSVPWSPDLATKLFQSTMDGLCSQLCEFDWREDLVVQAGREEAVAAGVAPAPAVRAAQRRMEDGLATPLPPSVRLPSRNIDREGADILFITGIDARERAPGTIAASAALLDHLGSDWTTLSVERDPGIDLWELGYAEAATAAASRFRATVEELHPGAIVTGSSRVLRALRESLPWSGLAALPAARHLSEFLEARLGEFPPALRPPTDDAAVVYHDPCSLGRRSGVFEAPRRLIERLTGRAPVEFPHHHEVAECCGEGGLLPEVDPPMAARLALAQLQRVPAGVGTLVTACPGCRALLGEAAERAGGAVTVVDLSELAAIRLGASPVA